MSFKRLRRLFRSDTQELASFGSKLGVELSEPIEEQPEYHSVLDAYLAATQAIQKLSGKTRRTLFSALYYMQAQYREQYERLVANVENQEEIMASMERVRDRNRRLEAQMRAMGATNAQINGNAVMTDAEWMDAISHYGRELFQQSYCTYPPSLRRSDFLTLARSQDEQIARVGKIVNAGMELEETAQ